MQNISRNHTFVTDISSSTGRNDLIWLWHGDLYRVSPFQVYRTSTSDECQTPRPADNSERDKSADK